MILRHTRATIVLLILAIFTLVSPVVSTSNPSHIYLPEQRNITVAKRAESRPKRPEYIAHPAGELVCRPFGECEPCPGDELDQPFCFPFGNRRLLHCIPASSTEKANAGEHVGEVPAWESCGKVVKDERRDFWEFVTANLLFLIVALTILWARTSALATEQYRQLAARIGIPSGGWTTA